MSFEQLIPTLSRSTIGNDAGLEVTIRCALWDFNDGIPSAAKNILVKIEYSG